MLSNLKEHRRRAPARPRPITIKNFDRGRVTKQENDKIRPDELSIAENVVFTKENARVRPGTNTFITDASLLDIAIYKHKNGNKLLGIRKDGTKRSVALASVSWPMKQPLAKCTAWKSPSSRGMKSRPAPLG
jgi:hypothetical protein